MDISISNDVEPPSEFRKRSADFTKCLKKDRQPILLTQHGKSAAVLMDVEGYERLNKKMSLLEDLLEAKQHVQNGDTIQISDNSHFKACWFFIKNGLTDQLNTKPHKILPFTEDPSTTCPDSSF